MFTGSKNHFTPHKIQQTPLPLTPMTAIAFQEAAEFGLDHKATLGFKKFMNTTRGPGSNFFSQHRDSFSPMGVATPIFTLFFLFAFSLAADTLIRGQGIAGIETLISAAQTVELGFFTPGNSQNRYLGIWFKKVSVQTVVWVANRQNPITTSSAVLKIANDGNLVVLDGRNTTLWSTNSSLPANSKSTAKLLDSGNLVLMADGISGETLWQSFDYPSDTLLSGMKVGINLKTGVKLSLTSWKTTDDPSPGNFTYEVDVKEWPEFFVLKNEINKIWRSGPWNGLRFSGLTEMDYTFTNNYIFTNNKDEIYFSYFVYNASIITRMTLDASGLLQRFTWIEGKHRWVTFWSAPRDQCESYAACGPFSSCNSENSTYCDCLHGFEPKFSHDWYLRDWSGGCVRRTKLNCGNGDGFLRLINMELPDTSLVKVDESLNLEECRPKCLNNCSCTAYATSDINGTGSGCAIWIGDLKDLRAFSNGGQEFYLRLHSSELDIGGNTQLKGSFHKKRTLIMALATFIPGTLLLVGCGCYLFKKKKKIKVSKAFSLVNKLGKDEGSRNNLDLPLFDFSIIEAATENFSTTNKLGHGGFGSVYKGKLLTGQDIAVKRLSKSSGQGIDEFENEVMLIVKLQHRNLVRLLGFCIHEEEKILVYEYMPNKSLDFFLFDQTKSALLDWKKRFHIIVGVARGLLYLHEDSRLRIIHRDLKPSNILLDAEMNPKISDFGMARIFGGNQAEANTMKVVGTYGYMSPEYAMNGIFSVKSDVFSFGVVVLEIVSGKKSNNFYHFDESLSLIGYGWKLWKEGRSLELMDPSIGNSCQTSEVLKCIHIGLLCVQESARDRPNMSSVVFMLGSEMATLPPPKKPSFPTGLTTKSYTSSTTSNPSINNVTNTIVEPR